MGHVVVVVVAPLEGPVHEHQPRPVHLFAFLKFFFSFFCFFILFV
jgi:hypothetical protein